MGICVDCPNDMCWTVQMTEEIIYMLSLAFHLEDRAKDSQTLNSFVRKAFYFFSPTPLFHKIAILAILAS